MEKITLLGNGLWNSNITCGKENTVGKWFVEQQDKLWKRNAVGKWFVEQQHVTCGKENTVGEMVCGTAR